MCDQVQDYLWTGVQEDHILNLYERASQDASRIEEKMELLFSDVYVCRL